jgi:hypothetical protein
MAVWMNRSANRSKTFKDRKNMNFFSRNCTIILVACIMVVPGFCQGKEFPVGLFGVWSYDNQQSIFTIMERNHFNIAVGVSTRQALDLASKHHIRCIVDHGLTLDVTKDGAKWNRYLKDLEQKVLSLKDHPAVYAWYPVDEPDSQNIPLDKIKIICDLIHRLDPKHPIFTVLTIPSRWKPYLPFFDIVAVDPYLKIYTGKGSKDTPQKVTSYLLGLKKDLSSLGIKKQVWTVLGAFEEIPKNVGILAAFRKPTSEEMNEMVSLALKEHSDGLLIWTLGFRNSESYKDWSLLNDNLWETVRKIPESIKRNKQD